VRPREVLAWIQAGRLAHARLGKHIRVHSEDLEDFRKRNTVKVTP
jgi:excisionase family DNA binding protein